MPITATDIKFHLSGGSANIDPNAALGGAIASAQLTDAAIANLFDNVTSAEASAGDTEYRCFYVKNGHASLTLQNSKIYIQTNTPSADSLIAIGLGSSTIGGVEQTIADEDTAPSGVTFSTMGSLTIGNIPPGQHKAVWLQRVISPNATAYNADSVIIKVEGDTLAIADA